MMENLLARRTTRVRGDAVMLALPSVGVACIRPQVLARANRVRAAGEANLVRSEIKNWCRGAGSNRRHRVFQTQIGGSTGVSWGR